VELGHPTKETITLEYLKKFGVEDHEIALWFDGKKVRYDETIKNNRSDISYLLFKQAAGTGWDCPRAHILVMFREISSATFYIQTLGRILRMAEPGKLEDYLNSPMMRTGYLFTNYKRDELRQQDDYKQNDIKDVLIKRRENLENVSLISDFIQRTDYGDLGSSAQFQTSFINSMDKWLGLGGTLKQGRDALQEKGLDLKPKITYDIITNAKFKDFDQISVDIKNVGDDFNIEMSKSDIEKAFNLACYDFLAEQTEDNTKIGNLARSWSPFKSALRVWIKKILSEDEAASDNFYKIIVKDLSNSASSSLRPALIQALKDYYPIRAEILKKREESNHPKYEFRILDQYAYSADYEPVKQTKCALEECMLRKDYVGRKNEHAFIQHLESVNGIDWWFKNHDYGKEHYAIKYFSKSKNEWKLFYPDWIVRFNDGKIGIYDTKSGRTAEDTDGRAEALAEKLHELGEGYKGGIAVQENGVWYVNSSANYSYTQGNLDSNWIIFK
jgi:type III restriction enzyme